MQAGQLRHSITIQKRTSTVSHGEQSTTWTDFVRAFASVQPLTGREALVSRQETADVSHKVIMRYQAGITPAMRVSYNGRFFDVQAVLNIDERNRELHLLCIENVNG